MFALDHAASEDGHFQPRKVNFRKTTDSGIVISAFGDSINETPIPLPVNGASSPSSSSDRGSVDTKNVVNENTIPKVSLDTLVPDDRPSPNILRGSMGSIDREGRTFRATGTTANSTYPWPSMKKSMFSTNSLYADFQPMKVALRHMQSSFVGSPYEKDVESPTGAPTFGHHGGQASFPRMPSNEMMSAASESPKSNIRTLLSLEVLVPKS